MNLTRRESIKALAAIGAGTFVSAPAFAIPSAGVPGSAPETSLRSGPDFQTALPTGWAAQWIAHPESTVQPVGIYHFRLAFTIGAVPPGLIVRVTADQRFRLFLNGTFMGSGPAQGDAQHWRFERIDLAPMLRSGRNILAAVIWYGEGATTGVNQMGVTPGFLLSVETPGDDGGKDLSIDTGKAAWRVMRNPGHSFLPIRPEDMAGYFALGPMERIEANLYPWGWAEADFDDSTWNAAAAGLSGQPRETTAPGGNGGHALEPSPLPAQQLMPESLGRVVRVEGLSTATVSAGALVTVPVVIPPGTKARLLIDHAVMTTAMLSLDTDQGDGAIVRLRYTEALVDAQGNKGDRNEVAGRHCQGYADEFTLDGKSRTFEPLYWRTFRFLQVEIESAGEPVVLRRLTTVFTGASLDPRAKFDASDPQLATIWNVGVRSLRCNAHEAYSDCPYWEQLQYIGDTRLSALTSFAIAGPRARPMVRNALELFDASRIPDGITQSRYPSTVMQLIPPFSLWYVEMIRDFWMHSDDEKDPSFIRGLLPGVRGVLDWFLDRTNEHGLLGPLPWWNFVDWPFTNAGAPPGAIDPALGGSSILTLQLILALRTAEALEESFGNQGNAERDRRTVGTLAQKVRELCWDSRRGLMADVPLQNGKAVTYSQHATSLAILAGVLSPEENTIAGKSLLSAMMGTGFHDVIPTWLYFRYYVHRALVVAGHGDSYVDWLGLWRHELALGLTTWPENPSPSRSDCHAWGSHPTRDLLTVVLGVESAAPGFREIWITPRLGKLEWAEGVVPHPKGEINVKLRRVPAGISAEISLPPSVPGKLISGNRHRPIEGHFSGILDEA